MHMKCLQRSRESCNEHKPEPVPGGFSKKTAAFSKPSVLNLSLSSSGKYRIDTAKLRGKSVSKGTVLYGEPTGGVTVDLCCCK